MEWFKLDVARVRSVGRLRLPASVEGTHVRLLAYAAAQEHGGVVVGAASFGDRDWLIAAGVTSGEVESLIAAGLAILSGEDLHLVEYDRGREDVVLAQRAGGRAGRRRQLAAASASGTLPFRKDLDRMRPTTGDTPGDTRGETPGREDKIREEKIRGDESVAGRDTPARPVKEPSDQAVAVATYLREAIQSHSPQLHTTPAQAAQWGRDIDLAIRIDKRTPEQLRSAIDFAHRSQDAFWRPNILSGKKLREKYDQLAIQARRQAPADPARDLWERGRAEMAEEARQREAANETT